MALETSEQHAANCDHIRGQQAAGVKGVDGVQRGGGADIDEGKKDGNNQGDEESVKRELVWKDGGCQHR